MELVFKDKYFFTVLLFLLPSEVAVAVAVTSWSSLSFFFRLFPVLESS